MAMDLATLKKQVNVGYNTDDTYLTQLLDTAKEAVRISTNHTEAELQEMGTSGAWPLPLQHAVLMLASHWYNQREAVASAQMIAVPYSMDFLIKPYRKLA